PFRNPLGLSPIQIPFASSVGLGTRTAHFYSRHTPCASCCHHRRWCWILQREFRQHVFPVGCPLRNGPYLASISRVLRHLPLQGRSLVFAAAVAAFEIECRRKRACSLRSDR